MKFALICYKNIKRNGLTRLWDKRNVLTSRNLLTFFLSEQSIRSIRNKFKRENQVSVTPEDIVAAVRRMLNSEAVGEMDKVKICLPEKKQRRATPLKKPNDNKETS